MRELRRRLEEIRTVRTLLLLASGLALVVAGFIGPGEGDGAFKLVLVGFALYVFSKIFDRR